MTLTEEAREPEPDVISAVLRPVRTRNAYEETVERLLQLVKLGLVAHGERLPPERELAERLKVSRVTVREAIRSLQQAGYIEPRRGRFGGTFVTYRPEDDRGYRLRPHGYVASVLDDVVAMRVVLEPGTIELAAGKELSERHREMISERLQDVESASGESYRQADARLHLAMAELTGSAMVTRAVADVRMALNDLLDALPPLREPLVHANDQHKEMVRALLAHDGKRARRVMTDHVQATAALLRGFLT